MRAALNKVFDVFKPYLTDGIGNRFDLSNKILKHSDLLAMILPYEDNHSYDQCKEALRALIYYSTKITLKEDY